MLSLLVLLLGQTQAPDDAEVLITRVINTQQYQQTALREYSFRENTVTRHLDKRGDVSKTEGETFVVTPATGGEYKRLVAKDGQPLSAFEESKEQHRLDEHIADLLRMTPEDREQKTRETLDHRIERYQERLEEAMEVYDFQPLPDALVDGQRLRVFRFAPRPGYQGHSRSTKIFARMEGIVWIDPVRNQLAKLAVELVEDLTFLGGIFGRVSRGTRATIEAELRDELWMLERADVSVHARLYFLKRYRRHITVDYDRYRKYEVDTEVQLVPAAGLRKH